MFREDCIFGHYETYEKLVIQMVDVGQLQNNLMGIFEERFNNLWKDIATRLKKLAKNVDKKMHQSNLEWRK